MRTLAVAGVSAILLLAGCTPPNRKSPSARAVVDSAIATHGGPLLTRAVVSFHFRDTRYRLRHANGRFHYQRRYTDSLHRSIQEGITNDGPYRTVDGDSVSLSPKKQNDVRTAVNSVAYFALLPYKLHDPAVQTDYDGRDTLAGHSYHRVRVTFQEKGGGPDWEDTFLYWFRTDTYAMNYLAYAFGLGNDETDSGTRFREAYNVRRVSGVRFADYRNYAVDTLSPNRMHHYPNLWTRDDVNLVSHITLDSIRVRPLPAPK